FYLDNWQSSVDSVHPNIDEERIEARRRANVNDPIAQQFAMLPHRRPRGVNENYGRELMELHTLGVNGGYTQADVTQVAKVFTGWTIDQPFRGGTFQFDERRQEPGSKTVLGKTIKEDGMKEGLEVLHMLATSPATAHFISNKLA